MMNGSDIKKAAINKAKQVAQAANGNGGKKRRKNDLKPIITTTTEQHQDGSPASGGSFHYKCVSSSTEPVPGATCRSY
jgi:serine/threonine-protein kinase SRPK3